MNKIRDMVVVFILSVFMRALVTLYYGLPVGKDPWAFLSIMQGYFTYTYKIDDFIFLKGSDLVSYPYELISAFVKLFPLYILGLIWKLPDRLIAFSDIVTVFLYALMSIAIYSLTIKIVNVRRIALLSGIISAFSVSQLRLTRINLGEMLGLLLLLITLIAYFSFLKKKHVKDFILFLAFLSMIPYVHLQSFAIIVAVLLVHHTAKIIIESVRMRSFVEAFIAMLSIVIAIAPWLLLQHYVRPSEVIGILSSAGQQLPANVQIIPKYYELLNIFGWPQVSFAIIGLILLPKIMSKDSSLFMASWVFASLIYIYQWPLGLPIAPYDYYLSERVFTQLYVPVNILAANGFYKLLSEVHYKLSFTLGCCKKTISIPKKTLNILKTFLLMGLIFSSSIMYIIGAVDLCYPMAKYMTRDEWQGIVWLKENINPDNVIIVADHNYASFISLYTYFRVLKLSSFSLLKFNNVNENNQGEAIKYILSYWLPRGYKIIIAQRKSVIKSIELPEIFTLIYENKDVKIYSGQWTSDRLSIIHNGGFERWDSRGIPLNWDYPEGNINIISLKEKTIVHDGNYSLKLTGRGWVGIKQTVNWPSDNLTLSFSIYINSTVPYKLYHIVVRVVYTDMMKIHFSLTDLTESTNSTTDIFIANIPAIYGKWINYKCNLGLLTKYIFNSTKTIKEIWLLAYENSTVVYYDNVDIYLVRSTMKNLYEIEVEKALYWL